MMHQKLMKISNFENSDISECSLSGQVRSPFASNGRKSLRSEEQVNARHGLSHSYFEEPAAKTSLRSLPPAVMPLYGLFHHLFPSLMQLWANETCWGRAGRFFVWFFILFGIMVQIYISYVFFIIIIIIIEERKQVVRRYYISAFPKTIHDLFINC